MDLYDVLRRHALFRPAKAALIAGDASLDYGQLAERARRLKNALVALGVGRGDRVVILSPNIIEYPETLFGCAMARAIWVPVFDEPTPRVLRVARDCEPRVVLAHRSFETTLDALVADGFAGTILVFGEGASRYARYDESLARASPAAASDADPDDLAALLYTSGTTGESKGVMHTQRGLLACAWGDLAHDLIREDDAHLALASLSGGGPIVRLLSCLLVGGTTHLMAGFEPDRIHALLARGALTTIAGYPLLLHRLVEEMPRAPARFERLRLCTFGGAPMTAAAFDGAQARFGGVTFGCQYGATEALMMTLHDHVERSPRERRSSVGRERIGVALRLVGADGEDVAPGEVGEIWARSESVMRGYWNRPAETARALDGRWLRTGDFAKCQDGYVTIVRRERDVILGYGVKVYPREVELVLERHPSVAEASVVGVKLEGGLLEAPVAFVRLVPHAESAGVESELRARCGEALAEHEVPVALYVVDEFPRAGNGKPLKSALAARAAALTQSNP